MFNSKKINNDPEPWTCEHGERFASHDAAYDHDPSDDAVCGAILAPRPEFDNNPNPILVAFRAIDAGRNEYIDWLRDFDEHPEHWLGEGMYSHEQVNHARKVLQRLAA